MKYKNPATEIGSGMGYVGVALDLKVGDIFIPHYEKDDPRYRIVYKSRSGASWTCKMTTNTVVELSTVNIDWAEFGERDDHPLSYKNQVPGLEPGLYVLVSRNGDPGHIQSFVLKQRIDGDIHYLFLGSEYNTISALQAEWKKYLNRPKGLKRYSITPLKGYGSPEFGEYIIAFKECDEKPLPFVEMAEFVAWESDKYVIRRGNIPSLLHISMVFHGSVVDRFLGYSKSYTRHGFLTSKLSPEIFSNNPRTQIVSKGLIREMDLKCNKVRYIGFIDPKVAARLLKKPLNEVSDYWYEYEIALPVEKLPHVNEEALAKALRKKAFAKLLKEVAERISDEKALRSAKENADLKVNFQDSIEAGNCKYGTEKFRDENFPGREEVTVKELLPFWEDYNVKRAIKHVLHKKAHLI